MPINLSGLVSGLQQVNQPNVNDFGIGMGAKDYASQTQAALLRANWDYSQAELEPILNRLQYLYNDPQGEQKAVTQSREAAANAFDRTVGGNELTMRMQGLALTPEQQASYDKIKNYQRGLATGGAAVTGAREYQGLRDAIATGI